MLTGAFAVLTSPEALPLFLKIKSSYGNKSNFGKKMNLHSSNTQAAKVIAKDTASFGGVSHCVCVVRDMGY